VIGGDLTLVWVQRSIATDMGATMVKLNGPRHWCLDGLGAKVAVVDPVFRDFNGLTMRRLATLELGADFAAGAYVRRFVNRGAGFFFDAGQPVYELVDPDGAAYVMQAYRRRRPHPDRGRPARIG